MHRCLKSNLVEHPAPSSYRFSFFTARVNDLLHVLLDRVDGTAKLVADSHEVRRDLGAPRRVEAKQRFLPLRANLPAARLLLRRGRLVVLLLVLGLLAGLLRRAGPRVRLDILGRFRKNLLFHVGPLL